MENMMINTLICDDEETNRVNLVTLLKRHCPNISIVGESSTNQETLEKIMTCQPHLVFLDIRMHTEQVFDILEKINQPKFEIIFATAYNEYALQAIKFNALDYLLKPIDVVELKKAVEKAKSRISKNEENIRLKNLITNLSLEKKDRKIVLPNENEMILVNTSSIIRCQAESNYTRFYFTDGRKVLVSKTLKEYEQALSGSTFVRVHQSHLINTDQIVSFVKKGGGCVKLLDGSIIPIAKSRKDELYSTLDKL